MCGERCNGYGAAAPVRDRPASGLKVFEQERPGVFANVIIVRREIETQIAPDRIKDATVERRYFDDEGLSEPPDAV